MLKRNKRFNSKILELVGLVRNGREAGKEKRRQAEIEGGRQGGKEGGKDGRREGGKDREGEREGGRGGSGGRGEGEGEKQSKRGINERRTQSALLSPDSHQVPTLSLTVAGKTNAWSSGSKSLASASILKQREKQSIT